MSNLDYTVPTVSPELADIPIIPDKPKKGRGRPRKNPLDLKVAASLFAPPSVKRKTGRKGPGYHRNDIPSEGELFTNHRKYCEELLSVRDKEGEIVPYVWNPVQIRLHAQIASAKDRGYRHFLVLKYRRAGITTYFQSRSFFNTANMEGQYCATLAHDAVSTSKIFEIALMFYQRLPEWARPKRKTENKRELNFPGLNSQFYIGTAGNEDFGRGSTLQTVHLSEVAFFPKSTNCDNLMAALQEATSHGELFCESTANGVGNWFHRTWGGAKEGTNAYFPIFLSWKDDPELCLPTNKSLDELKLDADEEQLVKTYALIPEQIMWRRAKMRELYSPDKGNLTFKQEYPINDVEAFISSGITFFDAEISSKLMGLCSAPVQTSDQGRMKVYVPPALYSTYVLAADIGEGVPGGNNTAITVYDVKTCEEVCSWTGVTSPEDAGRKCADLATLYNNALVAPEANNFGHSTINTLLHEIGYSNIFRHQDYQKINVDGGELTPKFGWQTNMKTRPLMLSEFRYALQGGMLKVNDPELFRECMAFVDTGHGKYEASPGSKDDRIMAHAIAWQARQRATETINLDQYTVNTGFTSIAARWEEM